MLITAIPATSFIPCWLASSCFIHPNYLSHYTYFHGDKVGYCKHQTNQSWGTRRIVNKRLPVYTKIICLSLVLELFKRKEKNTVKKSLMTIPYLNKSRYWSSNLLKILGCSKQKSQFSSKFNNWFSKHQNIIFSICLQMLRENKFCVIFRWLRSRNILKMLQVIELKKKKNGR